MAQASVAPATSALPHPRSVTPRAVLLGLVSIFASILLIHWAELVLGGSRGHTAMANTSIPVGAFTSLMFILAGSRILGRLNPRWRLTESELIVIYTMTTVSSVLASSGAIHFVVPSLAAPYHFASAENKWEELFYKYIPPWIGPTDERLLNRFFDGGDPVPVSIWLGPSIIWSGFIFTYALCSLCLASLVRHQWVDSERLTFPTVYVPLSITADEGSFWRNKVAWIGMAIPFIIGTVNNLNLNFPSIPKLEVRNIDLSASFSDAPWNAMGGLSISFYPFVLGIAYLLSSEVTFSCWFFFLFTKFQRVMGAMFGLSQWGTGSLARFPFEDHQGAGAFVALTILALWIGRKDLRNAFAGAFSLRMAESERAAAPRWAVWGLTLTFAAMMAFCRTAGMSLLMPALLLTLSLTYLVAATRIRAETGNAWLFGPRIDPQTLLVTTLGARNILPRDLTIMSYLSSIASFDLRCVSMPHQLDALKMAEMRDIPLRRLTPALVLALAVGIPVAFWGALATWHYIGALSKGDTWRTLMGKAPFDRLQGYLQAPQPPDLLGLIFVAGGMIFTGFLFAMRTNLTAWPFHPVGYAIANTGSMRNQWFPFLLSWAAKSAILRYGGPRLYRQLLPFFLGLVVGDFVNGGLYTLIGCFIDKMRVYPVNW
jgi:hypothetical protein